MAAAFPASGDDGRSTHNVAGARAYFLRRDPPGPLGSGPGTSYLDRPFVPGSAPRIRPSPAVHVRRERPRAAAVCPGGLRQLRPRPHDARRRGHRASAARDPAVAPINRSAARVLCRDEAGRILLMHWRDPIDGHQVWEPPGGGIEAGEEPARSGTPRVARGDRPRRSRSLGADADAGQSRHVLGRDASRRRRVVLRRSVSLLTTCVRPTCLHRRLSRTPSRLGLVHPGRDRRP